MIVCTGRYHLRDAGYQTASCHGGIPPKLRQAEFKKFATGNYRRPDTPTPHIFHSSALKTVCFVHVIRIPYSSCSGAASILVTTDVAARGLDLAPDHVILMDFPLNPIEYIHRAGRTARYYPTHRRAQPGTTGERLVDVST